LLPHPPHLSIFPPDFVGAQVFWFCFPLQNPPVKASPTLFASQFASLFPQSRVFCTEVLLWFLAGSPLGQRVPGTGEWSSFPKLRAVFFRGFCFDFCLAQIPRFRFSRNRVFFFPPCLLCASFPPRRSEPVFLLECEGPFLFPSLFSRLYRPVAAVFLSSFPAALPTSQALFPIRFSNWSFAKNLSVTSFSSGDDVSRLSPGGFFPYPPPNQKRPPKECHPMDRNLGPYCEELKRVDGSAKDFFSPFLFVMFGISASPSSIWRRRPQQPSACPNWWDPTPSSMHRESFALFPLDG